MVASGSRVTLIFARPFTETDCDLNPIKENSRTAFELTVMTYSPLISDCVPSFDPCTRTAAPGRGSLVLSSILPDTVIFSCAQVGIESVTKNTPIRRNRVRKLPLFCSVRFIFIEMLLINETKIHLWLAVTSAFCEYQSSFSADFA